MSYSSATFPSLKRMILSAIAPSSGLCVTIIMVCRCSLSGLLNSSMISSESLYQGLQWVHPSASVWAGLQAPLQWSHAAALHLKAQMAGDLFLLSVTLIRVIPRLFLCRKGGLKASLGTSHSPRL